MKIFRIHWKIFPELVLLYYVNWGIDYIFLSRNFCPDIRLEIIVNLQNHRNYRRSVLPVFHYRDLQYEGVYRPSYQV